MAHFDSEDLVVARQPGSRLFLSGVSGVSPSFEGPSHRTILFNPETAEEDLRRMRVPLESVEFRPAKLTIEVE